MGRIIRELSSLDPLVRIQNIIQINKQRETRKICHVRGT